jgi:hypothetical protein
VDFGEAGLDSYYHRAMLAIQRGDRAGAIRFLDELVGERPKVYRPRLMRAYLGRDADEAKRLAEENPASPEAQLVLELLGVPGARGAREALLRGNPDAPEQVEAFRKEITSGEWRHVRRYGPMLPEP